MADHGLTRRGFIRTGRRGGNILAEGRRGKWFRWATGRDKRKNEKRENS